MSQSKTSFAHRQDDTALCPEQNRTEAISQINQHAAKLQASSFNEQHVAQYICDLLAELSIISSKANLVFLTYLIDVAHEEARLQASSREHPYL